MPSTKMWGVVDANDKLHDVLFQRISAITTRDYWNKGYFPKTPPPCRVVPVTVTWAEQAAKGGKK